jgi:hypothetical protein
MRYLNWSAQLAMLDSEVPAQNSKASTETSPEHTQSAATSTQKTEDTGVTPVVPVSSTRVQDTLPH